MATPAWPSAPMPQMFIVQGFASDADETRDTFQPDKGPAMFGPGLMLPSEVWTATIELDRSLITTLKTFWETARTAGTFTFPTDPMTGETNVLMRFESPLRFVTVQNSDTLRQASFTVRRMP